MAGIPTKDLPAYVRRCWEQHQKINKRNRDAETERLKFYAGGDLQWRDEELQKRKSSQRPWISINRCKPPVDQLEGDIRLNPPGPQCHPVGGGADKDTADIIDGLIREVEYRSGAKTAYSTAGKYAAASGYAVIELATEYAGERDFSQRLVIQSVEDPNCVFFDPTARMANRQDASWAGKLKMYNKQDYIATFGKGRRVLESRSVQSAMGWIQEAMGIDGNLAQINEWTGNGEGPYYVCEFYCVEIDRVKLTLYDNDVAYFEDETPDPGAKPKVGDEYTRVVPKRTIKKYVVDAMEVLDTTEWPGTLIPLFPILGPEVYIEGKLHRLSLIAGAIDPQRALNYVGTTATELAGMLPKSPWIGAKGSFTDSRWQTAQSEIWAYLEYDPVMVTSETTGQQSMAPPPQRNMWEAPIQWLLALGAYFSDAIKAVTATYDASLGANKGDQSGVAIEQLRSESNIGNFSYADNLHRGIEVMYDQMCCIFPKILDGPRVVTIVRPDSQHEAVLINQIFDKDEPESKGKKQNNICIGQYSVRVTVGMSFPDRQKEAVSMLTEFFKNAPQTLAVPGVASSYLRMVGDGNPKIEQMADLLEPGGKGEEDATPQQLQAQLMQAQEQNQALTVVVKKMQQDLQAQLPKIEADKWKAALQALTSIDVAKIKAGTADTDREERTLEHLTGMAHESAMQAAEHEHSASQAEVAAEQAEEQAEPEPASGE